MNVEPEGAKRAHRLRRKALIVCASALALAASQTDGVAAEPIDAMVATPTFDSTAGGAIAGTVLTPDGKDTYVLRRTSTGELITSAPTNTSSNLREVLTPTGPAPTENGESCATWTAQTGANTQLGAAFRVRTSASGRVQAVTITQNIWYGARWIFNVHVWDTTKSPPMALAGSVDLGQNGNLVPKVPLRFCARLIDDQAWFKLWATSEPEPTWTDPSRSGTVPVPVSGRGAGASGWFVGHLPASNSARFDDMTTGSFAAVRPAWYPFASADDFVVQQDLDLTGRRPTLAGARAQAATITDRDAAARFVDDNLDGPWAGGVVGPLYRLYQAFFRRPPDQTGLVHWTNRLRSGQRLSTTAGSFARSTEFQRTYGPLSNEQFIDLIYRNVLGRPADTAGTTYWLRRLDGGANRGSVMTSFSESSENRRKTAPAAAVTTLNLVLLGRATPAKDLARATNRLAQGTTRAQLISEILGDGDYSTRVGATPTRTAGPQGSATFVPEPSPKPSRFEAVDPTAFVIEGSAAPASG